MVVRVTRPVSAFSLSGLPEAPMPPLAVIVIVPSVAEVSMSLVAAPLRVTLPWASVSYTHLTLPTILRV